MAVKPKEHGINRLAQCQSSWCGDQLLKYSSEVRGS